MAMMTRWEWLAGLAALGSAAMLAGALGFQYLGDLAPCKMCIWQRWPHGAAVAIGLALLVLRKPVLTLLGAVAAATTAGIGVFHAGVEQKWWEGPNTCTSGPVGGQDPSELLDQILAAPLVRCDEIAWSLMGISMAGWNAIISAGFACMWLAAWRGAQASSSASQ